MKHFLCTLFSLVLVGFVAAGPAVASDLTELRIERSEFILVLSASRQLRSRDLVGAEFALTLAGRTQIARLARVKSLMPERGGTITLHQLLVKSATGAFINPCKTDAAGERWGFPMRAEDGDLAYVCTSGAVGKCVLWGYPPWPVGATAAPMRKLHRACINMVRADYAGSGMSGTRAGVSIRFCDRYGIHECSGMAGWTFEAVWSERMARCVSRHRLFGLPVTSEHSANDGTACRAVFSESEDLLLSYFRPLSD